MTTKLRQTPAAIVAALTDPSVADVMTAASEVAGKNRWHVYTTVEIEHCDHSCARLRMTSTYNRDLEYEERQYADGQNNYAQTSAYMAFRRGCRVLTFGMRKVPGVRHSAQEQTRSSTKEEENQLRMTQVVTVLFRR